MTRNATLIDSYRVTFRTGGRRSDSRMLVLTTRIHNGNNSTIHGQFVMINNRTTAHAKPKKATQRGRMPVRSMIVLLEVTNTPAILIANTFKNMPISCRTR